MPKLRCRCGFVHDLSPIPDDGWLTVRDTDYEALTAAETLASTNAVAARAEGEPERTFVRLTGSLYECPTCGRILWKRPSDAEYRSFTLEDEHEPG